MNEELQKQLADVIGKSVNAAESAKDFLLSELPEVIQQLLVWKAVESALFAATGLILIGGAVMSIRWSISSRANSIKIAKEAWEKDAKWTRCNEGSSLSSSSYDSVMAIGSTQALIVALSSIAMAIIGLCFLEIDWLQILVAPKVYLIEYAAKLVG